MKRTSFSTFSTLTTFPIFTTFPRCSICSICLTGLLWLCSPNAAAADEAGWSFRAASSWEVDDLAAEREAELKLREQVARWLGLIEPAGTSAAASVSMSAATSTSTSAASDEVSREQLASAGRLLDRQSIPRRREVERRERGYGTMVRTQVEVRVGASDLAAWRADEARQRHSQRVLSLVRWLASAGLVAVGQLAARTWDRQTLGYQRVRITSWVVGSVSVALASIWWFVR